MQTKKLELGQKIKRFRLINDIRQEDMAEKMGVSRATLINYEKGHTSINVEILNKIRKNYPDFDLDSFNSQKPKILIDNTINFKVLFSVLIDKNLFITFTTLFFIVLGVGSSFLFKKYYEAEISLYPAKSDMNQGLGQFQSLATNLGVNSFESDQNFNIPDVVKSRLIANKVIQKSWTLKSGEITNLLSIWKLHPKKSFFSLISSSADSLVITEKGIKKLKKHIKVFEDRASGLIRISTTFEDPQISASIANFIGNEVEYYIQKENSAQSTKEKLFISERLFIVKSELESSELKLKDFKERNRGYENSPELFMVFSQLLREVEAKKEVYLTLQQQLELARIEEVKKSPILHILDYAVAPVNKSSPNRFLFLITFGLIGFIGSVITTVFRY